VIKSATTGLEAGRLERHRVRRVDSPVHNNDDVKAKQTADQLTDDVTRPIAVSCSRARCTLPLLRVAVVVAAAATAADAVAIRG